MGHFGECIPSSQEHSLAAALHLGPEGKRICRQIQKTQQMWVRSLGWEGLLEREMATHSSIFAWEIPWMEEPGRLWSMGPQRIGHD